jgi:hypothetical protein
LSIQQSAISNQQTFTAKDGKGAKKNDFTAENAEFAEKLKFVDTRSAMNNPSATSAVNSDPFAAFGPSAVKRFG